jgi:hypothetical protein
MPYFHNNFIISFYTHEKGFIFWKSETFKPPTLANIFMPG